MTFAVDAEGIVHVSARDLDTGQEQQIEIVASSGLSEKEIDALLRELMDRVESVGDLLWQMDRRHRLPAQHPQVDQVKTTRQRATHRHLLARKKLSTSKRGGMKV